MSLPKIIRIIVEFAFVELYAIVVGAGIGFMEGIFAFSRQKLTLDGGVLAALWGAEVAGIVFPVLYFFLMRNSLSLPDFIEMNALIVLVGILSTFLFGPMSWLWTIVAALAIVPIYCKSTFRILGNRK